ncbi:phosphotransferase family protein [Staphylococcus aureus]|uniref:phosphotransferase family protein n=1 Tax=Staphylococcus aureus TaxID=1280 RepID=UPI00038F23C4|nr:phosphotransferase family protein [Staphylococcus aureus]AGU55427.1 aminoglycoside phosphotransferase, putative [Staphylococcus aureus subsp. aureus 6850]MBD6606337.1 phosphotransferase family protein [Staphylococcus aureus]MBD6765971.1 phosphotransferase family protein [Staphylococcus aureus]MCC0871458.1 phosphotransferase family protein [Staphylococcus aureus]NDP54668.1 phosphotransferase family protein [Staphylococcus aureus]
MEQFYQLGWTLDSAGGASGEAYMAEQDGQKLFLKRNSNPFIAALSAEGIVPKLVWTKRIETGEVVTAQHWKNGRELSSNEMKQIRVAHLLKKIHNSRPLLSMLKRMEMEPITPEIMLNKINASLSREVLTHHIVRKSLTYLEEHMPSLDSRFFTVVHGDVNHNNWLLSDRDELFLVDWEGAMIADPAIDIGMLLYNYVPQQQWSEWLETYGVQESLNLNKRMKWYTVIQSIGLVQWYEEQKRYKDMNTWLKFLNEVMNSNMFI